VYLLLLLLLLLQEYADQDRLKGMVSRYSEFIDFPIYLQVG
jgi:HSP90 family molecular chaperone